jgi:hypothetical protein
MPRIPILFAALLGISLGAAACAFDHSSTGSVLAPTTAITPNSSTGTTSPASLVGTWGSPSGQSAQSGAVPNPSSCTNFRWDVTNQTSTALVGTFSAECGDVVVTGQASGQLGGSMSAIPVTVTGNAVSPVLGMCAFSLSGTGAVDSALTTLTIQYTGTTCLGPVQGSQTLRKTPVPPPAPPPPPPPIPPPPPSSPDAIDPSQITFVNNPPDLGSWATTARITYIQFRSDAMIVDFDKRSVWPNLPFNPGDPPDPSGGGIQYTLGLCFNISGHWYCSAAIQFWQGRDLEAAGTPTSIPTNWFYDSRWGPMNGYMPAQGETIGFFVVAGNVRNLLDSSLAAVKERSGIVLVPFDRGNGTVYTFSNGRLSLSIGRR